MIRCKNCHSRCFGCSSYPICEKWERAFQEYCDSDAIREESERNGINACGYGIQCDDCRGSFLPNECAHAMVAYCERKNIEIDYENCTEEYFRELLSMKWPEKEEKP